MENLLGAIANARVSVRDADPRAKEIRQKIATARTDSAFRDFLRNVEQQGRPEAGTQPGP
jgi:hypothetical protein